MITGALPGVGRCTGGESDEGSCPTMKSTAYLFRAMVALSLLTGCSSYRPTPAAFHEVLDQPYRLGAGDRIRVTVFEQEGLTNTYSVDQSGYISFPLVGDVPARGPTARQLDKEIGEHFRTGAVCD